MANFCYICNKGPTTGNRVSNANNRVKRRFMPNLQPVRILEDGQRVKVRVCTRCIKAGKVTKAP
ncbi:MAG: 50S ribosomal protein L28 [Gemmatimonadetes bacterium]|nr:MAG: 50S ribosomal protein L28 [Chloroflexota bacterium]TDJ47098.1 MAG: 50S ribosomal protein L28 [Gemmatimonadota bacterium]